MHPHSTTRACAHCGTAFTLRRPSDPTVYCSRTCFGKSIQNPTPQLVCAYCAKRYTQKYSGRPTEFCSRTCACKSRAKPIPQLTCAHCSTAFTPPGRRTRPDHTFCSTMCARKSRTKTPAERFWKHVQKSDDCWSWIGSKSRDGYGTFSATPGKLTMLAHRFSYQLHHGSLPDIEICHTCDNPSCVRPDHLFAGTHLENMHDAVAKGRLGRGLSIAIAREIRALEGIVPRPEIANRYNISEGLVWFIVYNRIWKE